MNYVKVGYPTFKSLHDKTPPGYIGYPEWQTGQPALEGYLAYEPFACERETFKRRVNMGRRVAPPPCKKALNRRDEQFNCFIIQQIVNETHYSYKKCGYAALCKVSDLGRILASNVYILICRGFLKHFVVTTIGMRKRRCGRTRRTDLARW